MMGTKNDHNYLKEKRNSDVLELLAKRTCTDFW